MTDKTFLKKRIKEQEEYLYQLAKRKGIVNDDDFIKYADSALNVKHRFQVALKALENDPEGMIELQDDIAELMFSHGLKPTPHMIASITDHLSQNYHLTKIKQ